MEKNIKKSEGEAQKKSPELSKVQFACETDAVSAANRLSKQLKYHNLSLIQAVEVTVRPETNSLNNAKNKRGEWIFKLKAQLELDAKVIAKETKASGRFILATNVMDSLELSSDEMIIK